MQHRGYSDISHIARRRLRCSMHHWSSTGKIFYDADFQSKNLSKIRQLYASIHGTHNLSMASNIQHGSASVVVGLFAAAWCWLPSVVPVVAADCMDWELVCCWASWHWYISRSSNCNPHLLQTYAAAVSADSVPAGSWWCRRRWILSVLFCAVAYSQYVHLYGFSPNNMQLHIHTSCQQPHGLIVNISCSLQRHTLKPILSSTAFPIKKTLTLKCMI